MTTANLSKTLAPLPASAFGSSAAPQGSTAITVDPAKPGQRITAGFGIAMTESSAYLLASDLAEPTRQAVNAFIRAHKVGDGVVDFDAAVRDPAHPGKLLPAYDGSDHLHFTAAGYEAMANAVPLQLLADAKCVHHLTHVSARPRSGAAPIRATRASPSPPLAATGGLPLAPGALNCLVVAVSLRRRRRQPRPPSRAHPLSG